MEFDKNRVFSAVNADELHKGDKVIVADCLDSLRKDVELNEGVCELKEVLGENIGHRFSLGEASFYALAYLVERAENCTNCALKNSMQSCRIALSVLHRCKDYKPKTEQKTEKHTNYNHCEEAKKACVCAMTNACPEKHYRPFRDTDELVKVWEQKWSEKTNGQKWHDCNLNMPHIWVQAKNEYKTKLLITGYDQRSNTVRYAEGDECNMKDLFEYFEFLDGSPCGVEE